MCVSARQDSHLHEGGVQDISGAGRGRCRGRRAKAAAAERVEQGSASGGDSAARVRLGVELLGRATKFHHLHSKRLAHHCVLLLVQLRKRSAAARAAES